VPFPRRIDSPPLRRPKRLGKFFACQGPLFHLMQSQVRGWLTNNLNLQRISLDELSLRLQSLDRDGGFPTPFFGIPPLLNLAPTTARRVLYFEGPLSSPLARSGAHHWDLGSPCANSIFPPLTLGGSADSPMMPNNTIASFFLQSLRPISCLLTLYSLEVSQIFLSSLVSSSWIEKFRRGDISRFISL